VRAQNGRRCTRTESSVCLSLLLIAATAPAFADDAPYAEYRYVRALGQIQIATGVFERTADLDSRKGVLERDGILIVESDKPRTFTRTEHVGAHVVVTTISLQPPVGHGEGGASSFADLKVLLDSQPIVDCPFSRGWGGIDRIVIDPARRFVTVAGHEGIVRYEGFESRRVVDEDWLFERAKDARNLIGNRK
jgi:hypothetical protein